MLCQPSSNCRNHQRRLAHTRAGGVKSCADSKQNRSCKPRRQSCRSLGKSRTENSKPSTEFAVRYPCTNQYSINALTDALGAIVERYAYDAYGGLSVFDGSGTARTSTAEANRYTYTGREWDEDLDLYHYRARMYDPVAGRFMSRDPIGFVGSRWNLHEGMNAGPTVYVDPTGLAFESCTVVKSERRIVARLVCQGKVTVRVPRLFCTISCNCPGETPLDMSIDLPVYPGEGEPPDDFGRCKFHKDKIWDKGECGDDDDEPQPEVDTPEAVAPEQPQLVPHTGYPGAGLIDLIRCVFPGFPDCPVFGPPVRVPVINPPVRLPVGT